jgi:FixJ family two-component response regulator
MPGLGGIETFKKIREMDSDVEIIIISSAGDSFEGLAHAVPNTTFAWIPKPFDMGRLVEAVEQAAQQSLSGRLRAAKSRASAVRELPAPAFKVTDKNQHDVAQMFSHDIKNRLNVVLGFVRMLREGQRLVRRRLPTPVRRTDQLRFARENVCGSEKTPQ